MNPYKHAQISVKRWGGVIEDYYDIHKFIDCTKEICSDNRHRILHTHWGITRIINPIFGDYFKNTDGKIVNIKDLCERDHILPDYRNKFIPNLSDFVDCIDESEIVHWKEKIEQLHSLYANHKEVQDLLLSPLTLTGQLKSLLLTHNSWFINQILPKVLETDLVLADFAIRPADIFNNMNFELWMDNGAAVPNSAKKINQLQIL